MKKRPSDLTIRLGRVIFGLILVWSLYYNLIYNVSAIDTIDKNFFWVDLSATTVEYIKYFFIWIWLVPLIMWLTNICLLKSKYIRIVQVIFWIMLFYIANQIIIYDANALDVDVLIGFMWLLPLIAWITGKCITTNCMRFAEKITKIRI